MIARIRTYLSFVRFSHSVFALPFALAGALLASRHTPITWPVVGWILVAMVAARSAAMGFNRLVDAKFDAENPRTANRELPRGAMSRGEARRRFTLADHRAATEGVECRKDKDVIDETPAAYKDIDAVMQAQRDLVEVVHTLKQVVCVKG